MEFSIISIKMEKKELNCSYDLKLINISAIYLLRVKIINIIEVMSIKRDN